MPTPLRLSEELVKTIAKLEAEYSKTELKLEIAKDSTISRLKADAVVHDCL
jgi:HAE1 family hydrophobic/amphiphilic exporter-1